MALSNIFREPRREITETLVGMTVALGFGYLDWHWAAFFADRTCAPDRGDWWGCLTLGMVIGIIGAFIAVMAIFIIHWIGEEICDALESRGVYLRPVGRRR